MTATVIETEQAAAGGVGRVARVIGPVVDVEFAADQIPEIGNALLVDTEVMGDKRTMTMEVALHIGDNLVRAIALKPTDGMRRGAEVRWGVAGRMAVAWCITLPAAALIGGLMFLLGHYLGELPGTIVIFGILLGLSYYMYRHAQKTPIDADNVNEEWDGGLAPTARTSGATAAVEVTEVGESTTQTTQTITKER